MEPITKPILNVVQRNRQNEPVGVCSVCSANPWVIEAAMRQAMEDQSAVCIESTCNQVNQFGGYTGLTPSQFVDFVRSIAARAGFPEQRILFGSDHLGPYPWRSEPSKAALDKAADLVRASVAAGYTKIHVDASMACAHDSQPLADEIIAVSDNDAFDMVKKLAAIEGVLAGSSAGAAVFGAIEIARRLGPGRRVATIIPDSAERYLSKDIFHFNQQR